MSRFSPLNLTFVAVALVVAASGALQCFWPEKLKEIQSSLPRGYDPESPLGRLLLRFQNRKHGLVYRLSGFLLLLMALLMIVANAPLAVQYAMEAVNKGMEMTLAEGLFLEATLFGVCCATEDKKEGTTAFLEKRPAVFKGR